MKRVGTRTPIVVALVAAAACGVWLAVGPRDTTETDFFFEEMTPNCGLDFTYRNGEEADLYTILESLGGGVALLDYDGDGLLDIFLTGGGHFGPNKEVLGYPNRLFRNEGGWHFRDVTAEVGLPTVASFYSHGCAVGDYDNDGWPDLLVTGFGRMALFRNDHGKFVDVTATTGLANQRVLHWSTSAAWADFDGDGWLDLFVCNYCDWSFANDPPCPSGYKQMPRDVCPPEKFKPLMPALYRNRGNGTFEEITASAGMIAGHGLGVIAFDADGDGRLDVFVANDGTGNHLYLNEGKGRFRECAVQRGAAYSNSATPDGAMGIAAADYNGTGSLSLFVTNFQHQQHALFRNLGNGSFAHAEYSAGLGVLRRSNVGFGVGFADFDLDGAEDLFLVQGHVMRYPEPPATFKQRPVLLRNVLKLADKRGQARFEVITDRGGPYFGDDHMGRGVALGDLDNDGGIDLVISHTNEPVTILRNIVPKRGHWLGLRLVGKPGRDAIGAKLVLEAAGQKLTRFTFGGGSYLSSCDRRVVFGLADARAIERLTVYWPSGLVQTWAGSALPWDGYAELTEGEPKVRKK